MTSTAKKTTTGTTNGNGAEVLKPIEAAVTAGKESVEAVVKAGTDAATKNYEQAIAMTKDQVEKASTALFRGYDEMTVLNKDNVEAVVASSTIVAKGYETIGREVMSFTQSAIETNIAATKAIFGAKTLRELVDLQADFARSQFDNALAESAKLTEMSVRVANDAIEPLQSRVNVTVEKLLKPVAA